MTTVYNRAAFEQAHARLRDDPAALTSSDIEQLTIWSADLGREGLAARHAALLPAPKPAAPYPATAAKSGGLSDRSIDVIAEGVVTFVFEQLRPILARLHRLEEEREKDCVRWGGTFKQGDTFRSGELVTHKGSLWV